MELSCRYQDMSSSSGDDVSVMQRWGGGTAEARVSRDTWSIALQEKIKISLPRAHETSKGHCTWDKRKKTSVCTLKMLHRT